MQNDIQIQEGWLFSILAVLSHPEGRKSFLSTTDHRDKKTCLSIRALGTPDSLYIY